MSKLYKIRTDLLAWAGLHRGKGISEEAMPRFHDLIDELDQFLAENGEIAIGVRALAQSTLSNGRTHSPQDQLAYLREGLEDIIKQTENI